MIGFRRLTAAIAGAGLAAALLAGCGTAAAGGGPPATLTVAFVVDPSWAQVPVAQNAGYFRQHGVVVHVVDFSTGVQALQALEGGQADIATGADVPAASALARDPSLRVIADGSRWYGSRIVARRSSGVTSLSGLSGKIIGTPLGTSADYFAQTVLGKSSLTAKTVNVDPSAMLTAIKAGNVAAVAVFQPYQEQVEETLGPDAVVLNSPGAYVQHSLYLASSSTLKTKAKAISAFFGALGVASKDLSGRRPAAVTAVAAATKLPSSLLQRVLPQFNYSLQLNPGLAGQLTGLARWEQAHGYLGSASPAADYGKLLDPVALAPAQS